MMHDYKITITVLMKEKVSSREALDDYFEALESADYEEIRCEKLTSQKHTYDYSY